MTESEPTRDAQVSSEENPEPEEEYAPTPFDNPFFLPVLLIGFSVWFIYDGWFNPDMEWIKFNRVGAAIFSLLAIFYTTKAVRERRQSSSSDETG